MYTPLMVKMAVDLRLILIDHFQKAWRFHPKGDITNEIPIFRVNQTYQQEALLLFHEGWIK